MTSEVVYRSNIEIVRHRGPLRTATLPGRDEDITFGVHSEIAEHYGLSAADVEPQPTTLDYVVAAAGG